MVPPRGGKGQRPDSPLQGTQDQEATCAGSPDPLPVTQWDWDLVPDTGAVILAAAFV
jgi:hypothetical protein